MVVCVCGLVCGVGGFDVGGFDVGGFDVGVSRHVLLFGTRVFSVHWFLTTTHMHSSDR